KAPAKSGILGRKYFKKCSSRSPERYTTCSLSQKPLRTGAIFPPPKVSKNWSRLRDQPVIVNKFSWPIIYERCFREAFVCNQGKNTLGPNLINGQLLTSKNSEQHAKSAVHELVGPIEHELVGPIEHDLVGPIEHDLVGPIAHDLVGP